MMCDYAQKYNLWRTKPMNAYMQKVLDEVKARNAGETLFIQTVEEVFKSIEPIVEQHPEYEKMGLLERMCEPERTIE